MLVFLLVLALATIFFVFQAGDSSAGDRPPVEGDWVIDEYVYKVDEQLEMNGNISIENNGELILQNTTITFNCESRGEFGILVDGGRLRVSDLDKEPGTESDASVIQARDPAYPFGFKVEKDSDFSLENSRVQHCGFLRWNEQTQKNDVVAWPLSIYADNAVVTGNNFSHNVWGVGMFGSTSGNISGNEFYNNTYGIYLVSSNKNTITDNYFFENAYSIYFKQKSNLNTITDNTLLRSSGVGVLFEESNFNTCQDNDFQFNNFGVWMVQSENNVIQDSNFQFDNEAARFTDSENNRIIDCSALSQVNCIVFTDGSEYNEIENCQLTLYNVTNETFLVYSDDGAEENRLIDTPVNLSQVFCLDGSIDVSIRLSVNTKDALYHPLPNCDLKIEQGPPGYLDIVYATPGYDGGVHARTDQDGFIRDIILTHQEIESKDGRSSNGTNFTVTDYVSRASVKKGSWVVDNADINTSASYTHEFIKPLPNVIVVDKNGEWDETTIDDAVGELKNRKGINTIFIHNGIYNDSELFELSPAVDDTNWQVIGESEDGVIIRPGPGHPDGKYGYLIGCYVTGKDVSLSNLTFQGWEYGVYIDAASNIQLTDVSLIESVNPGVGVGWKGVGIYSSSSCTVTRVLAGGCDIGVFVSGSSSNVFDECTFNHNPERNLMFVKGSQGNTVKHSRFVDSACGLFLSEDSSQNSLSYNWYFWTDDCTVNPGDDPVLGAYVEKNSNGNTFRNESMNFKIGFKQIDFYILNSRDNKLLNLTTVSTDRLLITKDSPVTYLINPLTSVSLDAQNGEIISGFFLGTLIKDENDEVTPIKDVEMEVVNNGEVIYATEKFGGGDKKTDVKGKIRWVEVYNGSLDSGNFTPYTTIIVLEYGSWKMNYTTVVDSTRQLVFLENQRPSIEITALTKQRALIDFDFAFHEGDLMVFKAEAVDDGGDLEYQWYVVLEDGSWVNLSSNKEFEIRLDKDNLTTIFGYGEHTVHVRVKDKFGLWSTETSSRPIEVRKQEIASTAEMNLAFILGMFLLIILAMFGLVYMILYNKLKYATRVEDMFVIYEDGRQIHHETRRMKPVFESELISSMFTAVQDFIADSFKDEKGVLRRLDYGELQILVERGEHLFAAVVLTGDVPDTFRKDLKNLVHQIETEFSASAEKWSGDAAEFRGIREVIQDQFYSKLEKKSVWLYIKDAVGKKDSKKPGDINGTTDGATGTTPESEGAGEMDYGDENKP